MSQYIYSLPHGGEWLCVCPPSYLYETICDLVYIYPVCEKKDLTNCMSYLL